MDKIIGLFSILAVALLVFVGVTPAHADDDWKIYHLNATLSYPPTSYTTDFKIPYKITNGTLQSINYDAQSASFLVYINDTRNGILEITIPKDLINSITANGKDDRFYVLINGMSVNYQQINNTNCFRTVSIKFNSDSKIIEIPVVRMPVVATRSYVPSVFIDAHNTPNGDILISGCTDLKLYGKNVIIGVINPQGQAYKTISVSPDMNGSFSTSVPLEGNSTSNAAYTVNATYAGHTVTGAVTVPEFPYGGTISIAIASLIVAVRLLPFKLRL